MTKHSVFNLSLTLCLVGIISVGGCGRNAKAKSVSATEEAPPALPHALSDTNSAREATSKEAVLTDRIGFGFDDARLSAAAKTMLSVKATVLQASPRIRLRVEGHADEQGSEEYNKALGMRRAMAVKRYLVQQGIDPQRLYVISHGEKRTLERGHSEAAWSINRRVEFGVMSEPIRAAR
jgi:peptidoglycan-associated lipoprotein